MRRWVGVFLGLAIGSFAGCLLELDLGPSCGDGTVDKHSEDCDPSVPGSFAGQCRGDEIASCDPFECTVHCARCGDDVLDENEACDGNNVRTRPVCQVWACVDCQVQCPRCGNGLVDPGEECDFEFEAIAGTPDRTQCDEIMVPGRPDTYYEPGGTLACRSDCRWDRSGCNLCGNGQLDGQVVDPNTGGPINAAERCDGEVFDLSDRFDRCESVCGEPGRDCKAACGEGCLDIRIDPADSACCVRPGYARSASNPCCCELPRWQVPSYCSDVFEPPIGGGTDGGTTSPLCPG